jgi:hypothetical protein
VSKEPDSCWIPVVARLNELDWPTLILEVGASETLHHHRKDAHWWLANSQGAVKIVLLINIDKRLRTLRIEKWENRPPPADRPTTRQSNEHVPIKIQAIDINANGAVTGTPAATTPPLVLQFQDLLLRPPVPPEQDLIYTAQDLQELATPIWTLIPEQMLEVR